MPPPGLRGPPASGRRTAGGATSPLAGVLSGRNERTDVKSRLSLHTFAWAALAALLAAPAGGAQAPEGADAPAHAVAGPTPKWTAKDIEALRAAGRRVPAYLTERWGPPKHVLAWARPGRSGRIADAANWLLDGEPLKSMAFSKEWRGPDEAAFDFETDVYLPPADRRYTVGYSDRSKGGIRARHVTIGANAKLAPSVLLAAGNVWMQPTGRLRTRYIITLTGGGHCFFHNDTPPFTAEVYRARAPESGHTWMTWIDEHGYEVAQYFGVRKDPAASVEFLGAMQTSDDFQFVSGTAIVAPGALLMSGTRSTQVVAKGATLRLMSGSTFCKPANCLAFGHDLVVEGRLEAGTKQWPLAEHAYLPISFKPRAGYTAPPAYGGFGTSRPGLLVADGAEIVVHTSDVKKARLVITRNDRFRPRDVKQMQDPPGVNDPANWYIDVVLRGRPRLEGVEFDYLFRGGLMMDDPGARRQWRNVFHGPHNQGAPEELPAWYVEAGGRGARLVEGAAIRPDGAYLPTGETVEVALVPAEADMPVRYTLDGAIPGSGAAVYGSPLKLGETTTVTAAAYKDGTMYGLPARGVFRFAREYNLAHLAKASASTSFGGNDASRVNDLNDKRYWRGDPAGEQWVALAWDKAVAFEEVRASASHIGEWKLQVPKGDGWRDLATGTGGFPLRRRLEPVTTTALRLLIVTTDGQRPVVPEIEVYAGPGKE